ncbi:uncharacterized protein LOC123025872 [Varanus komodoensis]|uniref:uncharacterized protein LOC123025872 n=1 Tax=Varanus komodoensis TaxID=61221 RepID=UPI001CF769CB|nr:uncharacterized protein LOC123025872 [Varanus komodoensis]
MASTPLRWRPTAVAPSAFLLTIFFISGASTLTCFHSTLVTLFSSEGKKRFSLSTESMNVTCSSEANACMWAQLELSTDGGTVLVNHGDCALKDLRHKDASVTSGEQYVATQSDVHYCLHDFCNVQTAPGKVSSSPGGKKVLGADWPSLCYSGFNFEHTEPFLERVRCRKGYSQCYQGESTITVGLLVIPMYVRTCQRQACAVPSSQSFGPVTITSQKGSCCTGSYCNAKNAAAEIQKHNQSVPSPGTHGTRLSTAATDPDIEGGINRTSPVPTVWSLPPGHPWESSPSSPTTGSNYDYDKYDADFNENPTTILPFIPPRNGSGPQRCPIQLAPLLVILRLAVLGIWWWEMGPEW